MAQTRGAHAAFKAFGLTTGRFSIDQQAQPFGMGQVGSAILCLHLSKGFRHAVEPECFELIQCGVIKHILSSSMKVPCATDVGMCDRRLVRGAASRCAIQTILENGMQGLVGVAVDVQCALAGGIKAASTECFGQPQDAHACSVSLFWMAALAHDHLYKGLDIGPDARGLCADTLWRPVSSETVIGRHVVADRGMFAIP